MKVETLRLLKEILLILRVKGEFFKVFRSKTCKARSGSCVGIYSLTWLPFNMASKSDFEIQVGDFVVVNNSISFLKFRFEFSIKVETLRLLKEFLLT